MEIQQKDEIEIDLMDLLHVLRGRIVTILLTGFVLAAIIGLGTAFIITPSYQSTSKLYIVNQTSTVTSLTDLQTGSQLTQDYMVLVTSRPVLEQVIENMGLNITYEGLAAMVSLNNPTDTRILEITVTSSDPYMAKEIVDEISEVSMVRIASIMNVDEPTMVEYGHLSDSPSSPNIKRNILAGGAAGILLSAAVIVIMYLMNDTIRTEEDVEKYLGLNNLAMIPVEEGAVGQMMKDRRKRKEQNGTLLARLLRRGRKEGRQSH
ncbi:MAG: Wzz/FepE/Etk N-terminal domain-containing protein [Oscillospiraceae bacterium]|nr:Wzz/FepE/Etk N-terminal domain-containing protein [Oscillospiraceae bacterium]